MSPPALTGIEHRIIVGIAEMTVANDPDVILATYSLGSCLGVAIFDPVAKAGGLLHVMLPDSGIDPAKALEHPCMFVDTGVPTLFRSAYQRGADKHRLLITVAGGADILDCGGCFNIGERNGEALRQLFQQHGLHVHATDIGGTVNRTMQLHLGTGQVRVKTSGTPGETTILCKNSTTT